MKIETVEITKIELAPFLRGTGLNKTVDALIDHQLTPVSGFPALMENMKKYRDAHFTDIEIQGIKFRVAFNPTRKKNIMAETFINSAKNFSCPLCHLLPGQKGVKVLNGKYIIIVNPGLTIPGDLTIPSVSHDLQILEGHYPDMLALAKNLTDYTLYFNGPMAGASCPHFHFQAGLRDRLPAEIQLNNLLGKDLSLPYFKKRIFHDKEMEIFRIEHFLRPVYCFYSSSAESLTLRVNLFLHELKTLNRKYIHNLPNVPDFGVKIDVFGGREREARFNVMTKYYPEQEKYLTAFFPKIYNRPQGFFDSGKEKIILGLGIKESLGNILTASKQDYYKILNRHSILTKAFRDTAIPEEMNRDLLGALRKKM